MNLIDIVSDYIKEFEGCYVIPDYVAYFDCFELLNSGSIRWRYHFIGFIYNDYIRLIPADMSLRPPLSAQACSLENLPRLYASDPQFFKKLEHHIDNCIEELLSLTGHIESKKNE